MSDENLQKDQATSSLTDLQNLLSQAQQATSDLSARRQAVEIELTALEQKRDDYARELTKDVEKIRAEAESKKTSIMNDVGIISQKLAEFSSIKDRVEATTNELVGKQSSLDSKIAEIEGALGNLRTDLANLKQAVDAELPSFRQKIESEQATLRQNIVSEQTTFRQAIEADQSALRQKLEELSTSFQTKHTEQQEQRSKEFTDKINELQHLTNQRITEEIKAAEKIMEVLERYEDQAKQVLGTVVRTSQAGVYKLDAIEEGKAKKFFRAWASTFMLFAVVVLIGPSIVEIFKKGALNVTIDPNISIDWHEWLKRLPVSVVLFLPAFYFARESTRHSNSERKSKRLEQILSTIDPYLELLDVKLRDPLKVKLAEQIFNPNEASTQPSDDEVKGFLTTLLTAIKTVIKKDQE